MPYLNMVGVASEGSAEVLSPVLNDKVLHSVIIYGTPLDGYAFSLMLMDIGETAQLGNSIFSKAGCDGNMIFYPRVVEHADDGSDLTSTTLPIIHGRLKANIVNANEDGRFRIVIVYGDL